MISSNEDASCRHAEEDVQGVCAINQGRSKFEMRGLGLEDGTCSIGHVLFLESIILP